ncbi:hypothetical protein [Microcoleus sp. Pol12A5]
MSAPAKLYRTRVRVRCGRESPTSSPLPKLKYSNLDQKADRPFDLIA